MLRVTGADVLVILQLACEEYLTVATAEGIRSKPLCHWMPSIIPISYVVGGCLDLNKSRVQENL